MLKRTSWTQSLSTSTSEEKYTHCWARIALIFFTISTFFFSLVLNVLNASNYTGVGGFKIYELSTVAVIEKFPTHVSPSAWFAHLWVVIFVWQFLWLIYGVTTICRKSSSDYLYKYPPVMHWLIYLNFSVINVLNVITLLFWSKQLFMLAACYSLIMSLGSYIATFTSMFKLSDYQREMYYTEKIRDVWAIRILVQNGMIMYASWSFVMFLFTLNLSLVYELHVSMETSHLVVLGLLFVKVFAYFLAENFTAYAYTTFVFTPWLVYIMFLSDTLATQVLVKHKLRLLDDLKSAYTGASIETDAAYSLMNTGYLLHTCVTCAVLALASVKLCKFVWNQCCARNRFVINF